MTRADELIEEALGTRPVRLAGLSGGCVAEVHLADMPDGSRVVAKIDRTPAPKLDLEGWMLEVLRTRSALPVPEVLACRPRVLVLAYIPNDGRRSDAGEREAGAMLAALHGVRTEAGYGMERDTLIGPLDQPNGWMDDWPRFYAARRLRPMARLAHARGGLGAREVDRIESLCGRLDELLGRANPPGLIHGDCWSGNVLWNAGRVVGFIDPAVHYADPEVELAFVDLMGGCFGRAFWSSYASARPIRPGWDRRRSVYQLYPLLVHAALFGGGYGHRVARTLSALGT